MRKFFGSFCLVIFLTVSCAEIIPEHSVILRNDAYYAIAVLTIGEERMEARPRSRDERRIKEGEYDYRIIIGDILETGVVGIYQDRTIRVYFDVIDERYTFEWR